MALYADSAPATPAEEAKPPDRMTEPEPVSTADELEAAFSQAQPDVTPQNRDRAPAARPGKDSTPPRFTSADETPSREILKILPRLGTLREKEWRSAAAEAGADKLDMRFLEGVSLLRRGMFADSMDTLSDEIRRSPDYSAAWYFMGKCANLTGALTDAEEYLRNAIERDPKQPDFYLELAVVLEKQKRDTEALTLFRKANSIRRSKRSNEKV
jgi:tetratricopeptide (TPR) repeat protein